MHSFNDSKDRTHKQPLQWACMNIECWELNEIGDKVRFEFTSDRPRCPKCTVEDYPYVLLLTLTHLLMPNQKGKVFSQGRRWSLACDDKRELLATPTNQEAATGHPELVNCPKCCEFIEKNRFKTPLASKLILAE